MDHPLQLHVDGLTDIGNRRDNNEDAWWAGRPGGAHCMMEPGKSPLQLMPSEGFVLLQVSDGVGGANAGEVASHMSVSLVAQALERSPAGFAEAAAVRPALVAAMREAHRAILVKAEEPGHDGMAATLSAVGVARDGQACWAQAGDSRIYHWRAGRLRQVSRDHSPVGRLKQQGRITEAEAREHPARNRIDLSLGDRLNPFEPDSGIVALRPGDVLLLCSDGLSDGLWDHEIAPALTLLQRPADLRPVVRGLVANAKRASGRDNITVVAALAVAVERRWWWRRLWS